MKILFTGGGTGGHFYPLVAVARKLRDIAEEEKLVSVELVFIGDKAFDQDLLNFEEVRFIQLNSGKIRNYASSQNFFDYFRTGIAVIKALWILYTEFPDVVFSKGGYISFPVLFAARVYNIPVIIHESDAVPGKVNKWAGKFAKRIAISFPEVAQYFPEGKVALTGTPIRTQILGGNKDEALELFRFRGDVPTVLVLGGSQGARAINNVILQALPQLLEKVQVIHQTGLELNKEVLSESSVIVNSPELKERYRVYPFLDEDKLRNASRIASLVVSRAGGNAIFEIASWATPSILIPLPLAAQNHQRENAYSYARAGGCEVIEETNLTPNVLAFQIFRLIEDKEKVESMRRGAQKFSKLDAAESIAREIILLGLHQIT